MNASRLTTHSKRLAGAAAVAALALSLAACASSSPEPSATPNAASPTDPAAASGQFPVTIDHVFGSTTIDEKPERVATVAWSNHEVPIALGVIPVGMAAATWGDDDGDGVLPWVEEALTELGAATPTLWNEDDGLDFEAVADSEPDVILATYSGLTQEEYDKLSLIAPVVAYPEVAWGTSWQDMVLISSQALGLADEGVQLVADLESEVETALANEPALDGKRILFSYIAPTDLSQVGFYTTHDTRPGFFVDLGLPMPAIVDEVSATTTDFYTAVSSEEADRFADVDLFVTYGEPNDGFVEQMQADPLLSKIPAIAAGAVAILPNSTPIAASANPSPLSISWGIADYFALLAAPLQSAG